MRLFWFIRRRKGGYGRILCWSLEKEKRMGFMFLSDLVQLLLMGGFLDYTGMAFVLPVCF